jgi:uncharacterized membrane protein
MAEKCNIGPVPASLLRWSLLALAVLWAGALVVASYSASLAEPGPVSYSFALAVYGIGTFICHQRPERSFHLWMTQLPVCARCAGIYFGAAIGLLGLFLPISRLGGRVSLLAVALVPTTLTIAFEWATATMLPNAVRAAAGALLGVSAALLVLDALQEPVVSTFEPGVN